LAIAAGDHPSSNLMSYSGGTPKSPYMLKWADIAKSTLTVQPSFATIQKGILSCEFKIY